MGKRLNEGTKAQIIALRESGKRYEEIAEVCNVSKQTVYNTVKKAGLVAGADKPAEIEQVTEPVTAPKSVLDAVLDRIELEEGCIADRLAKIKRMQQEIEGSRTQVAELKTWLEVNGYDSTED